MKKAAYILILLMVPCFSMAQQNTLEEKRGFQDIILDTRIDKYDDLEYDGEEETDRTDKNFGIYEPVRGAYQSIGDIPVKDMKVKTFDHLIIEIKIKVKKDPSIMKALKSLYGEPSYSVRGSVWEWNSENVILTFTSDGRRRLLITYKSRNLNEYIRQSNEEKIEDISSDF